MGWGQWPRCVREQPAGGICASQGTFSSLFFVFITVLMRRQQNGAFCNNNNTSSAASP